MHLSPYCLHCSVCNTEHWGKGQWLHHLSTEKHQSLARELCVREWGLAEEAGLKMRRRCLLMFSSFPVTPSSGGALRIIQHFSKSPGVFVTDFLCWEERPCLAILQFESAKISKKVISSVVNSELDIDGRPVQIKLGTDLSNLEWRVLFPIYHSLSADVTRKSRKRPTLEPEHEEDLNSNSTSNQTSPPALKKVEMIVQNPSQVRNTGSLEAKMGKLAQFLYDRGLPPAQYKITSISENKRTLWSCSVIVNGVEYTPQFPNRCPYRHQNKQKAHRAAVTLCQKTLYKEFSQDRLVTGLLKEKLPVASGSTANKTQMLTQFQKLCLSVTVPDSTYNTIREITERLQTLLSLHSPNLVLVPLRNLHLRLTNPNLTSANKLLFFVYSSSSSADFPNSFTWLSVRYLKELLSGPRGQQHFSKVTMPKRSPLFQNQYEVKFRCKRTGTEFALAAEKQLIVEAQVCQLLEYMVTFDSRCHSLMALTFYWAKVNKISFGELMVNYAARNANLPEPLTLEWMVIHFMCHKGHIPTVREIQARPHTVLREKYAGIDIGFGLCPQFGRKWRLHRKLADPSLPTAEDPSNPEFVLSVLNLFQRLLQFYGQLGVDNQWILNTRDGEVIKVADFLKEDPGPSSSWTSRMTSTDLFGLRMRQCNIPVQVPNDDKDAIAYYQTENCKLDFTKQNLYMVHPFIFTWRFSFAQKLPFVLQLMEHSAKQLKSFLDGDTEVQGISLETVLTVVRAARERL